jgi:hypothetical protein
MPLRLCAISNIEKAADDGPDSVLSYCYAHIWQDWIKLFNMVENMRYGTVLTANDLKGRMSLDPIWRVPASSGGLRCPGENCTSTVFQCSP